MQRAKALLEHVLTKTQKRCYAKSMSFFLPTKTLIKVQSGASYCLPYFVRIICASCQDLLGQQITTVPANWPREHCKKKHIQQNIANDRTPRHVHIPSQDLRMFDNVAAFMQPTICRNAAHTTKWSRGGYREQPDNSLENLFMQSFACSRSAKIRGLRGIFMNAEDNVMRNNHISVSKVSTQPRSYLEIVSFSRQNRLHPIKK